MDGVCDIMLLRPDNEAVDVDVDDSVKDIKDEVTIAAGVDVPSIDSCVRLCASYSDLMRNFSLQTGQQNSTFLANFLLAVPS